MERSCDGTCGVCGLVPLAPTLRKSARVIAESPAMAALLKRAARFAPSDAPVVVLGETGSGKEVVARVLHANSPRADQPFVAVNAAALPAELLESELFGHTKGAFTGAAVTKRGLLEEAHGGTLFLDEVAEMPLALQAKLLRALSDGEVRRVGETRAFAVDARIVCATHRDLAARVREGSFREDLYFRLKVLTLRVPPLRERPEDLLPLAMAFLSESRRSASTGPQALRGFARDARERMLAHTWPGNVRELQNVVTHGAALAEGPEVRARDLPEDLGTEPTTSTAAPTASPVLRSLADVEREHIQRVLAACGGSQTEAARVLGIGRNTLWRKIQHWA